MAPKVKVTTLDAQADLPDSDHDSLVGMTLVEVGVIACNANELPMAGPHR
jgi:hypothetical protein